ncbi:UNVERIFIED_CONTAM: hypothetical protein FKN15_048844 [Acipenser sinensis]
MGWHCKLHTGCTILTAAIGIAFVFYVRRKSTKDSLESENERLGKETLKQEKETVEADSLESENEILGKETLKQEKEKVEADTCGYVLDRGITF